MTTSANRESTVPSGRPVPRATYRLQLNKDFTFAHVKEIAPYLGKLGISHAYLSPILKARPGSTHGYDTVDHDQINPELGTLDDFYDMARALREHGLGIILDIVPNHMGIGGEENPTWLHVLEWGQDSQYADWFDINWSPAEPSLQGRVLMPFLGCAYGEALKDGRLELRYDKTAGSFAVYAEKTHKLPVDPRSYGDVLRHGGDALKQLGERFARLTKPEEADELKAALAREEGVEALLDHFRGENGQENLDALIQRQHWRPARYSVASDDINYRRFFVVSDLAAIRIENEAVFDAAHRLTFQLVEEGWVQGLRIDHIDGLIDPKQYTLRLREKCPRPVYILVEKILAPHEQLRTDWNVDGTTGYEFATEVNRLLIDPDTEEAFSALYQEVLGKPVISLHDQERGAKLEIIDYQMAAELDALTVLMRELAESHPSTVDLTYNTLRILLRQVVASLPVYRTYVDGSPITDVDARNLALAFAEARKVVPTLDPAVFDFLHEVATAELCRAHKHYDAQKALNAAQRLQQYTGPVMAKGLEDTALYRYNRMIALSDVGSHPDRFGLAVDAFHDFNRARLASVPHGMLLTSSHDTKRGEDTRARIAALSRMPGEWRAAVVRWQQMLHEANAPEIDVNDLYYFFQQLLGAWPAENAEQGEIDRKAMERFTERMQAAMLKAIREARVHTSWTVPGEDYERKLAELIDLALTPGGAFIEDFRAFEAKTGLAGAENGLVAVTLKLTSPGVPDIYQGAELWEQSMVDPDNRRPVDFAARHRILEDDHGKTAISLEQWRGGAPKLQVVKRLLDLRTQHAELFAEGSYEPLPVTGTGRAIAFLRRSGETAMLVVARLGAATDALSIDLPADLPQGTWRNVLGDGEDINAQLLADLPVAVLVRS